MGRLRPSGGGQKTTGAEGAAAGARLLMLGFVGDAAHAPKKCFGHAADCWPMTYTRCKS